MRKLPAEYDLNDGGTLFIALMATRSCRYLSCILHTHLIIGKRSACGDEVVILDSIAKIGMEKLYSHLYSKNNSRVYTDFCDLIFFNAPGAVSSYKAYELMPQQLVDFNKIFPSVPRHFYDVEGEKLKLVQTFDSVGVDFGEIRYKTGNDPSYCSPGNTCRDSAVAFTQTALEQEDIGVIPSCFRNFSNYTAIHSNQLVNFGNLFYIFPAPPKSALKQTDCLRYTVLKQLFCHLEYLASQGAARKFSRTIDVYKVIRDSDSSDVEAYITKVQAEIADKLKVLQKHRSFWHLPYAKTCSSSVIDVVSEYIAGMANKAEFLAVMQSQRNWQIAFTGAFVLLSVAAVGLVLTAFQILPVLGLGVLLAATIGKVTAITAAGAAACLTAYSLFKVREQADICSCLAEEVALLSPKPC